jgi:hypothetical protein
MHVPQPGSPTHVTLIGGSYVIQQDEAYLQHATSAVPKPPIVILSAAKDQVGRPESSTLGMLLAKGALLLK